MDVSKRYYYIITTHCAKGMYVIFPVTDAGANIVRQQQARKQLQQHRSVVFPTIAAANEKFQRVSSQVCINTQSNVCR